MLVYLAGPITGCSYDGCTNWRQEASQRLWHHSDGVISTLSPMRGKDYLSEEVSIEDSYTTQVMSSQRGIFYRDRFDCLRADLVIVNFLDTTRVSIGTAMEVAWADANKIPIVLMMKDGDLHDHAMIREACGFRVETLADACAIAAEILLPDGYLTEIEAVEELLKDV